MNSSRTNMGALQIGISILGLATAVIHISLLFPDVLFILNGLGYLTLLAAYFLPIRIFQERHNLVRWGLIIFTSVTILAWIAIGERSLLGYATKLIELALITLLVLDGRQSQSE
jgi:hypothetical protein